MSFDPATPVGSRCVGDETLALLLDGQLDDGENREVRDHLDACDACRSLFSEVARGGSGVRGASPATAAPRLFACGDVIAEKYRIERLLGQGGMGHVYGARHVELDQLVAIKVMKHSMVHDRDAVRRFAREARAAAALRNEHALRIHDVGRLPTSAPYIVMEHLEGRDLASILEERRTLSVADAVEYILQACEAVAEAHERGIIHRDLKPHNLFLTEGRGGKQFIKVLDFGLAKALARDSVQQSAAVTGTNVMLGSPFYMPPEQVDSARDTDGRSDIWSLGATLYHLVAGIPPFLGPNIHIVCARILTEDFPSIATHRPDAPPALEQLLRRCMNRDRALRFQDVGSLIAALRELREVAAPVPAPDTRVLPTLTFAYTPTRTPALVPTTPRPSTTLQAPPAWTPPPEPAFDPVAHAAMSSRSGVALGDSGVAPRSSGTWVLTAVAAAAVLGSIAVIAVRARGRDVHPSAVATTAEPVALPPQAALVPTPPSPVPPPSPSPGAPLASAAAAPQTAASHSGAPSLRPVSSPSRKPPRPNATAGTPQGDEDPYAHP